MGNQTTQAKTKKYKEEIDRWEKEDVLQLANHFHKLNTNKGQFERTSSFTMNVDDVATFQEIKDAITDIKIYMALDAQDKEQFTFFPLLKVIGAQEEEYCFQLYPIVKKQSVSGKSEVVPELFKDIISENWDAIDINLVDDLFTARVKDDNGYEATVRVKYYQISKEIINDVIKQLSEIKGVTFYSGIDMNKFSDKYQISFTPVLGFQHDQQDTRDFTFGLKSILELSSEETFIEYSRPCPPTC